MKTFLLLTLTLGLLILSVASARALDVLPGILPGIIGDNSRRAVLQGDIPYPYDKIGRLMLMEGNVMGLCTATLVGEDLLITAAHCVTRNQAPADLSRNKILFTLGYAGGLRGQEKSAWVTEIVRVGWSQYADSYGKWQERPEYDWALLRLDQKLGKIHGFLPVSPGLMTDASPKARSGILLAGYGYAFEKGEYLVAGTNACNITQVDDLGNISHDCDTWGGDSGTSLIRCTSATRCVVAGVHARGVVGKVSGANPYEQNGGVNSGKFYGLWKKLIRVESPQAVAALPL